MSDDAAITRPSGQPMLSDLLDPESGHKRENTRLLERAIRAGYINAFHIDYPKCKAFAMELCESDDLRAKAAGTKVLTAMANHDLKLMEMLEPPKAAQTLNVQNNTNTFILECDRGG